MFWKKKQKMLDTLFLILVQQARTCSTEQIELVSDLYVVLANDIAGKKGTTYLAQLCRKGTDAIKAVQADSAKNSSLKVTGGNKDEKTENL